MATSPVRRDVGRPRIYSDEAIFHGTDVVLRRDGLTELTLEAIAHEVGCTRQALVRRFGSKQALLLAFLDAMVAHVSGSFAAAPSTAGSALAALRTRFTLPPNSRPDLSPDARVQANLFAFMLIASSDSDFAARFAALNRSSIDGLERLVRAASEQGELQEVDARKIAHVLHTVWAGETVNWCVDPTTDFAARLSTAFDLVIEPHRVSASG